MHALPGANEAGVARVRGVLGSRTASGRPAAVRVMGLAGAPPAVLDEAQRVVTATERAFATDTLLMAVSVSQAQAALHLARGDARRALQALDAARPYETGRMALLVPICCGLRLSRVLCGCGGACLPGGGSVCSPLPAWGSPPLQCGSRALIFSDRFR